jgi:hypothetical protein
METIDKKQSCRTAAESDDRRAWDTSEVENGGENKTAVDVEVTIDIDRVHPYFRVSLLALMLKK